MRAERSFDLTEPFQFAPVQSDIEFFLGKVSVRSHAHSEKESADAHEKCNDDQRNDQTNVASFFHAFARSCPTMFT